MRHVRNILPALSLDISWIFSVILSNVEEVRVYGLCNVDAGSGLLRSCGDFLELGPCYKRSLGATGLHKHRKLCFCQASSVPLVFTKHQQIW